VEAHGAYITSWKQVWLWRNSLDSSRKNVHEQWPRHLNTYTTDWNVRRVYSLLEKTEELSWHCPRARRSAALGAQPCPPPTKVCAWRLPKNLADCYELIVWDILSCLRHITTIEKSNSHYVHHFLQQGNSKQHHEGDRSCKMSSGTIKLRLLWNSLNVVSLEQLSVIMVHLRGFSSTFVSEILNCCSRA
jgi:hypothetical protein